MTSGHGRKYPVVHVVGKGNALLHRMLWAQQNGPIPKGVQIILTCGHNLCLERKHMKPMSRQEAVAFHVAAGAWKTARRKVSNVTNARGAAKLDRAAVADIQRRLAAKESKVSIGKVHNVNERTIGKIDHGQLWRIDAAAPNSSVFAMRA